MDIIMLKGIKADKGSSGGASDYADLPDKPSINGVTLSGNKSSSDLSLADASDLASLSSDVSDLSDGLDALEGQISGLKVLQVTIASSQYKDITATGVTNALIITNGSATGARGVYLLDVIANGTARFTPVLQAPGMTLANNTGNSFRITNGTSYDAVVTFLIQIGTLTA